jgi:3-hydroxyisobutyrate dehydrogenase
MMKIAFIGLGNMGSPMAHNLLKGRHTLTVYDLNQQAVQLMVDSGARAANSPGEAVKDVDYVVTMLPTAAHVRNVLSGPEGILANVSPGATIIDSSTIDPASVKEFASLAATQGNLFVDAPVSGGTGGAAAGTLTFMVGGESAAFAKVRPVLEAMGKNIVHCGDVGTGQVAKICNNLVLGITMAGVSEAMSLGAALGIDPKTLSGILNTSTGRCWSSDSYNPYPGVIAAVPASKGYVGGFGTDLMLKDLALAAEAARSVRQPVFMGALAQQLYQTLSAGGDGRLDFSAVIKLYRRTAEATVS